jgi:hypothetical protein
MGQRLACVGAVLALTVSACAGDDDDRSVEAAEWCEITARIDSKPSWDPVIDYQLASEWVDAAPEDIRDPTERAAGIRRELPKSVRKPAALVEAEEEIAAYKADNCPERASVQ